MIDALEVVIALLRADAITSGMVGGRVANRHRYGDTAVDAAAWTKGQASITVRMSLGGQPALYTPTIKAAMEVRCYAATPHEAMQTWLRLADLAREANRIIVQTAQGQVLLYYLIARDAAVQIVDEETGMDVALSTFEAMVYREAIAA